jgi:hypothetical protein
MDKEYTEEDMLADAMFHAMWESMSYIDWTKAAKA